MKSIAVSLLILLSHRSTAQWAHEKLLDDYGYPVSGPLITKVNRDGVAMFTMVRQDGYGHVVFKGRQNLTELVGGVRGIPGGLNEAGQVAWRGDGHVWVDTERITEGVPPGGAGSGYSLGIRGITADGRPFWKLSYNPSSHKEPELYLGRERFHLDSLLGTNRELREVDVNADGVVVWYGWGDATGRKSRVYRNSEDVSTPILGPTGEGALAHDVNGPGRVLWSGRAGPWGVAPTHTFVDDRNVSLEVLGDDAFSSGIALNDNGQVLWDGGSTATDNWSDVFLDGRNLSRPIYGAGYHQAYGYALSETGHVIWSGYGDLGDGYNWDVFVDDMNLSAAPLGPNRNAFPVGVDDFGRGLWSGFGDATGQRSRAYVNQLDLVEDAIGNEDLDSWALAIGPNGHVLWYTCDRADPLHQTCDVWLSRPVPEPSALLLGLPAVFLLRRRQTRRPRRSAGPFAKLRGS